MKYKQRYTDNQKQAVYENSCDCLYYGYTFFALNKCGMSDEDAKVIWRQAKDDMSKDF